MSERDLIVWFLGLVAAYSLAALAGWQWANRRRALSVLCMAAALTILVAAFQIAVLGWRNQ